MFFNKNNNFDAAHLAGSLATYFDSNQDNNFKIKIVTKNHCDLVLQYKWAMHGGWSGHYLGVTFCNGDDGDVLAVTVSCYPYKFKMPSDKNISILKLLQIVNSININGDKSHFSNDVDVVPIVYTCVSQLEPIPRIYAESKIVFENSYNQETVLKMIRSVILDLDYQLEAFSSFLSC